VALSLEVKRPGGEVDHSPPSSAEVKNAWSYTSTPQYVFMAWCLVKHRDNFTFYPCLRPGQYGLRVASNAERLHKVQWQSVRLYARFISKTASPILYEKPSEKAAGLILVSNRVVCNGRALFASGLDGSVRSDRWLEGLCTLKTVKQIHE
jgi:hypothetical protein